MRRLSSARRYTVAVLLTSLALSLALLGEGTWGVAGAYSLFLGAVMLSSWFSGLGPGLVATALGTLAADYFLIAPLHSITFDASRLLHLTVFAGTSVLISWLNDDRRRAVEALDAERVTLEDRVGARTAELASANDRLRAEIERRNRSERNFRGLIDAAPDAIVVIDTAGRVIKVNDEAERMFGYPREALLGRDVEVIVPERFRAAHWTERERYADSSTARTIAGDLAARRADGTEFPIEIRISPLEMENSQSIVGIVRDVTDRRRAEQEQQRLVHDLGERVKELTALHATGRLLNEPADPRELLIQIVALLPPAWQYPEVTAARIVFADIDVRTPGFEVTPWLQRAEFETSRGHHGAIEIVYKEERPAAAEGVFLAEERSLIESLAAMLRAYFERLRAEEDRINLARAEEARLRAQEANRAKDQFILNVNHELRTPLTAISGFIELLLEYNERLDVQVRTKFLKQAMDGCDDLQMLIGNVLDTLQIDSEKEHPSPQAFSVLQAIREVLEYTDPRWLHSHRVHLDISEELVNVANEQYFRQVLRNLLSNAFKYTAADTDVLISA